MRTKKNGEETLESLDKYFKSIGYFFPESLVSQFYTALKTKGFVILSGLSGTGKTKIAQNLSRLLQKVYPQLMAAWGSEDTDEEIRTAIEEISKTIKNKGYATLLWGPAGKAGRVGGPFILWTTYNKKVKAGFVVKNVYTKDQVQADQELWDKLQEGFKWINKVYNEENKGFFSIELERLEKKHGSVSVFELVKVYPEEFELSKFERLDGEPLSIPQSGYVEVRMKDQETLKWVFQENKIFCPVRPDWRDSKPLIGYYNPLDGKYYKTPLLDLILKAIECYEKNRENAMPYFVILDEMNLAHVEYYFADFLSVLESGRDESGYTVESIKLHDVDGIDIPKEIRLPPNLYVIGTVNMDETTYAFSPKVLDRAFTIEFHDVDLENYVTESKVFRSDLDDLKKKVLDDFTRSGRFLGFSKAELNDAVRELRNTRYWEILKNLNRALEPYDLHFGYRVVDEIALFFRSAKESWENGIVNFQNEDEILDLALLMKVLPKFHGNRKKLEKPLLLIFKLAKTGNISGEEIRFEEQQSRLDTILNELRNLEGNYKFKHTARKVLRMLRQLYEIGFASFS